MLHVKYGTGKVDIGVEELFIECPSCESHQFTDVMISSVYYYFFWVPIMPVEKEASLICQKCRLKRFGLGFDSRSLSNNQDLKSKFKHPFFTYIGIGLMAIVFVGFVIAALLNKS